MCQLSIANIVNKFALRSKPLVPVPKAIWQQPLYFIAFGFGSGAMPFAPGTFGTLMAIPFYLLLQSLPLFAYCTVTLLIIIGSAWLCEHISNEIQIHDHPGMCIDEIAGFLVTMINAPKGWSWIIIGFILFRFFDIFKPWLIRSIDKHVHGGIGMVLDDVAAGVISCLIIQLIRLIT